MTVVFFFALFSLALRGQSAMIIVALTALGLLVQVHLSSLSLAVVLGAALVIFRPSVRAWHGAIGLTVLGLLMSRT